MSRRAARPRRRIRLAAAVLASLALLAVPAAALGGAPQTSRSDVEDEVMCPVCGTLLELAEAPQAQQQKAFIARLIDEGRSKEEIKDALVAEYGEEVLAVPRGSGFNLSAYLVPIVAFLIAAVALAVGVLRWRRGAGAGTAGAPGSRDGAAPRDGPSDEDSARLDADLSRYDL